MIGRPEKFLQQFITENLGNGTLATDDFLHICALPKLKKRYFNLLLASEINIHVADEHGETALFKIAGSGNSALLQILLQQGLNPMQKNDSGEIPLSVALRCGNRSVAQCLLEKTENPASIVDNDGSTLLHKVAQSDMTALARQLIDVCGIPLEAKNNAGQTAVHVAASYGCCKMLKYLLEEKDADVNAVDNAGRTPLFCGANDWKLRVLKILCAHGANVSVKDKSGLSAWEVALDGGNFEATKILAGQAGLSNRQIAAMILKHKAEQASRLSSYVQEIAKINSNDPNLPMP